MRSLTIPTPVILIAKVILVTNSRPGSKGLLKSSTSQQLFILLLSKVNK
ncbi:hypothetical protein [Colwellia sp. 20A7]